MININEHNFSKSGSNKNLSELFFNCFKKKNLIPFFGSGLTKGEKTKKGFVPSVQDLSEKMINLISQSENFLPNEINTLKRYRLSELSEIFWTIVEEESNNKIKKEFTTYILDNFTKVSNLPKYKKSIIDCNWRYIYTLNYDDAIENVFIENDKELSTIIPFDKINKSISDDTVFLYKIHGDAKKYYNTSDNKFLIASKSQYLKMITEENNEDLYDNLMTDFASNNLIFFGCSLEDELDLILSAQNGLSEKKKMNKVTKCFYVKYINSEKDQLLTLDKMKLEQMGITDIIYVLDKDFPDFYFFIKNISDSVVLKRNEFDDFSNFSIEQLSEVDRKNNIEFLFYDKEHENNKHIIIPSFFIRREVSEYIIKDINDNTVNTIIIRGSHFSGKSYVLLDLLNEYKSDNVIYFKSGTIINDDKLYNLCNKKDTLVLFDEDTISFAQLNMFLHASTFDTLKKNNLKFILTIDCSIGIFTKHFFEDYKNLMGLIKIYSLSAQLSDSEIESFCSKVGKLGLINFEKGDTLMDYILKINQHSFSVYGNVLPDFNIWPKIEKTNPIHVKKILKIFLLLFNQSSFTISDAIKMRIHDVLSYCDENDFPFFKIVQKEMLIEGEITSIIHDSYKVISNSRYWIYRCLLCFANDSNNYELIAQVYYEIVYSLKLQIEKNYNKKIRRSLYNKIKPYYFLDTIQKTFYKTEITMKSGSISLPEKIYEKLLPLLNDNYQYLHQKAKCLLRKSRLYKETEESNISQKKDCLDAALQQINRALQLAEANNIKVKNVEHSIYHMKVTKVLILLNEWRYCSHALCDISKLSNLMNEYMDMLHNYTYDSNDIFDREFDDQELNDVKWFINDLLTNNKLKNSLHTHEKKLANEIINESNRRIFGKYLSKT